MTAVKRKQSDAKSPTIRDSERPRKIRLSLDVTPEMKKIIEDLAERAGTNQGEVLRRALALFFAAKQAEADGESVALVKKGKITAKLVGF